MEKIRLIILTTLLLSVTGCFTFNNCCPEVCVPEITELESSPDIHTALLTSSLKEKVTGDFKCGFYFGKDKKHMNKTYAYISGKEFQTVVQGLDEGTFYWYCAFVSNGINESCSGYKSFITEKEPVEPDPGPEEPEDPPVEPDPGPEEPEDPPVEPDPGPEEPEDPPVEPDPGPEEPEDPPVEPDPGPEEPEDPPVEPEPIFDVKIIALQAEVAEDMVEIRAKLSGNTSLVKDCRFYLGESEDNLFLNIEGNIDGDNIFGLVTTPPPGIYWFKAEVSDGKTVVNSEIISFEIKSKEKPEPEPEPKPEFTVSVSGTRAEIVNNLLYLSAEVSGDICLIKRSEFLMESVGGEVLKLEASRNGSVLSAFVAGLQPGVYKARAIVTDGLVIKKSEVVTIVI